MQTFEPEHISRLFIKQITNLTRYDTVYVPEDIDASKEVERVLAC